MDDVSGYLQHFVEDANFYNCIMLGTFLPEWLWVPLPRSFHTWLHNYIGALLLYFILRCHSPRKAMLLQIYVSMKSLPWYTLLPTTTEYMIETGWTRCFPRVDHVGWFRYLVHVAVYLIFVEFGIYWMHKWLHDIKLLYKHLHALHHICNKQNTLSPFDGLALHPLDEILLASPDSVALFIVPMHFTSHFVILFIDGIWTANIHGCIHAKLWPIMGAGYHTIHHMTYRHNYGHQTLWIDWMFGTLLEPKEDEAKII